MSKINYEKASLICIYDSITKTINELETHYKAHPSNQVLEEILYYLKSQKDCLKSMKKTGINNCLWKSLSVSTKELLNKYRIKDKNKVVSKRKPKNAKMYIAALLALSLTINKHPEISLISDGTLNTKYSSFEGVVIPEMEVETVEVKMDEIVGSPLEEEVYVKTLIMDKYYNIACPIDLQEYIFSLDEKWGIPADVAMTLVDRESDGQWNTNGVVSPTDDYGLPQINKRNHAYIERELGYTTEDIKNDPYKSLDAMFLLLTNIFNEYGYTRDNYDLENVAGAYNGWTTWKSKEQSVEYANACVDIYNTKFTKGDDVKLLVRENN